MDVRKHITQDLGKKGFITQELDDSRSADLPLLISPPSFSHLFAFSPHGNGNDITETDSPENFVPDTPHMHSSSKQSKQEKAPQKDTLSSDDEEANLDGPLNEEDRATAVFT
jgi:hypothetical protein